MAGKGKKRNRLGHIGKVVGILSPRERFQLVLVGLGSILMALIEVVSVGSIMPFVAVASRPDLIEENPWLSFAYHLLGFKESTSFLIFLGVAVLFFLILTNVVQAVMHWAKVKFTSTRRHSLAQKLMAGYLGKDYEFFLTRDSHEFVKNINAEITQMISGTLIQFVEVVSRAIQVIFLVTFLFLVSPFSTLLVVVLVGGVYGGIYTFIKRPLKRLGKERFELSHELARVVSEAFWGIKEVKITGTEQVFLSEMAKPSRRLARNNTTNELMGDIPKFALETTAFSAIMLFVIFSIVSQGSFADAAATASLFAFAGYRLIPALQNLFKGFTKLRYGIPTAERMVQEFQNVADAGPLGAHLLPPLPFEREICFRNIHFQYHSAERPLFRGLNLTMTKNSLIGLAGTTGSGKTTLVDMLLGLLQPDRGTLEIDGNALTGESLMAWQRNIGYVPQNIFLSNTSIAANIAFGVPRDAIDMAKVEHAARLAQLHEFVSTELPDGYLTEVGERGIRISGGQRQRVGIARALYRNPSVLIMDEATSALDGQTEKAVMEAIDSLQGTRTIVLIAHRLSTLRHCDTIFLMEKGAILDQGNYAELASRHQAYFGDTHP